MHTIDIILPLYRPKPGWDAHISENAAALRAFFQDKAELRFFLVDDGSGEGTFPEEQLNGIRQAAGNFTFLSYAPNRGKGYCVRYAVRKSDADFILYTDGDFPFGWKGLAGAWEKLEKGADVVMGVRDSGYAAALSPCRKIISGCVRRMNRILLGLPDRFLDTQAGLKGFNRRGRQAFLAAETESFLFDTEFILIAWTQGLTIETTVLSLREGLHFSRMGLPVILRELRHFARILWQLRLRGKRKILSPGETRE